MKHFVMLAFALAIGIVGTAMEPTATTLPQQCSGSQGARPEPVPNAVACSLGSGCATEEPQHACQGSSCATEEPAKTPQGEEPAKTQQADCSGSCVTEEPAKTRQAEKPAQTHQVEEPAKT